MKEKVLKNIPELDPEDSVVIKELNYGEQCDLMGVSAEIMSSGKKEMTTKMDFSKFKLYLLAYSIKGVNTKNEVLQKLKQFGEKENTPAIIEQKISIIRSLNRKVGDFLFLEANTFNSVEDMNKKKED